METFVLRFLPEILKERDVDREVIIIRKCFCRRCQRYSDQSVTEDAENVGRLNC